VHFELYKFGFSFFYNLNFIAFHILADKQHKSLISRAQSVKAAGHHKDTESVVIQALHEF